MVLLARYEATEWWRRGPRRRDVAAAWIGLGDGWCAGVGRAGRGRGIALVRRVRPRHSMFVELAARTHFSFLRGGSSPRALVERAAELGYDALGIADCDGLYGMVRALEAAKSWACVSSSAARWRSTTTRCPSCGCTSPRGRGTRTSAGSSPRATRGIPKERRGARRRRAAQPVRGAAAGARVRERRRALVPGAARLAVQRGEAEGGVRRRASPWRRGVTSTGKTTRASRPPSPSRAPQGSRCARPTACSSPTHATSPSSTSSTASARG